MATTQQLTVSRSSKGTSTDVTSDATYVSSDPAIATVSASGLVTSVAAGTCTVTATYEGLSADCAVTVTA